jgi:hypothetical protein
MAPPAAQQADVLAACRREVDDQLGSLAGTQ